MADASLKGRREETIHPLRPGAEQVGDARLEDFSAENVFDVLPRLAIIYSHRLSIMISVVLAAAVTLLVTTLLVRKSYRAIAIIRPLPKAATAGRIAGMLGGMGGGSVGGLSPLAGLIGVGGGPGSDEAEEYMTILTSFAFNTALVRRHHLEGELTHSTSNPILSLFTYNDPNWQAYKRLMKRLSCDYSPKTGNITLYFKAWSREDAERISGYYVDDLREKLRTREIQGASAAIDSMKAEARVTSDALLQTQLYELIAKQTQQLKLAQVEADFAFTVLEPPAAPDKPYTPNVLLDVAVAGFLALVLSVSTILAREALLQNDEVRAVLKRNHGAESR